MAGISTAGGPLQTVSRPKQLCETLRTISTGLAFFQSEQFFIDGTHMHAKFINKRGKQPFVKFGLIDGPTSVSNSNISTSIFQSDEELFLLPCGEVAEGRMRGTNFR